VRGRVSDAATGWRHRRSALVIGVLCLALCVLALTAGQGRAQPARRPVSGDLAQARADIARSALGGDVLPSGWSRRRISDSADLTSVSCPSSSFCMALADVSGDHGGHAYAFTYSHHKWSRGHKVDPYTYVGFSRMFPVHRDGSAWPWTTSAARHSSIRMADGPADAGSTGRAARYPSRARRRLSA
jgi:hypothetical protein